MDLLAKGWNATRRQQTNELLSFTTLVCALIDAKSPANLSRFYHAMPFFEGAPFCEWP
jgi:hypothetical protein